MNTIKVADFTEFPGPRFAELGPGSGEQFREEILIPAIQREKGSICVDLDGTMGYGSSFLEEAFGGLIRAGVKPEIAKGIGENLLSEDDPSLILEIQGYIADQAKESLCKK